MKKFVLSVFSVLCVFSLWAINYGIEDYSVQVVVGKNAVHEVDENIVMNFYSAGHGFYRDIPVSFSGSPITAKINSVSCSAPYVAEYGNGYYSMKIGDADRLVKGVQDYNIQYSYDLGIDTNEDYDEFYFDLLGTDWECSVGKFSFEVFLPREGLNIEDVGVWVTTGLYGSDKQVEYDIGQNEEYYVFYGDVYSLQPGRAVTIRIQLPEGWYVGAREPWDLTETFRIVAPCLSIILVIIAFVLWTMFGKDRIPVITAIFNPPEGFSPMFVGYLADGSVDDKDVIAMIFNWADRGLMTINEKKKDQFTFTKLAEIETGVPKAECDLFNAFFRRCSVGDTVTLKNLQQEFFAESMMKAKIGVRQFFTGDRALNSSKARAFSILSGLCVIIPLVMLNASSFLSEYSVDVFAAICGISFITAVISIVSMWALFRKWFIRKSNVFAVVLSLIPLFASICFCSLYASLPLCLICCLSSYALAFFSVIMEKKTEYGQKVFEEVLGYREFIEKVNMDELRLMIDKDPEIYYKVLSYAVVLGLSEQWSKKFKGIALSVPSWYIGSSMVDAMYYNHMASRMRTVIAMNSIPQNRGRGVGGGGFNVSGFAGGGFGGGGGRAW